MPVQFKNRHFSSRQLIGHVITYISLQARSKCPNNYYKIKIETIAMKMLFQKGNRAIGSPLFFQNISYSVYSQSSFI